MSLVGTRMIVCVQCGAAALASTGAPAGTEALHDYELRVHRDAPDRPASPFSRLRARLAGLITAAAKRRD
jgi:hypothetical protein